MAGDRAERLGEKKDRVWRKMREPGVSGETRVQAVQEGAVEDVADMG